MAYFPFFIDIQNKKCCIVGGGNVAFRKIEALLPFGASITVISPTICKEIVRLEGQIQIYQRECKEADLEEAFFVIAATDNTQENSRISNYCIAHKIPVNAVDEIDLCSFIFPAYIKKGDITVGVTTSGKSPIMARKIKQSINELIPDYYEALIEALGDYRKLIKKEVSNIHVRGIILKELANIGIENKGNITLEDVYSIINKYK